MSELINSDFSQLLKYNAGDIIFDYGEDANNIYIVVQGEVALSKKTAKNQDEIIELIKSGGLFGELALTKNLSRKTRAISIQDEVSVFSYPAADFFNLIEINSEINRKLISTLVLRIQQLLDPVEIDLGPIQSEEGKELEKENRPGNIYLEGHKNYNVQAPEEYQHFIYSKEIACPVCGNNFKVKIIRKSRLRLEKIKDNLRKIYKDFEPIWYRIRVCPECYYSAPGIKFNNISKSNKKKIRTGFKKIIEDETNLQFSAGFSNPRNLNEVFNSYYLNIACYNFIETEIEQVAASWLRLSWLYQDQGENELAEKASKKAYHNLKDFYYRSNKQNLNSQTKEKLALLLADLSIKHGYHEEATSILDKIVRKSTTKPYYKELARDKFIEIRKKKISKE